MNPITELYAFTAPNPDEEGIVAFTFPGLGVCPLVFARERVVNASAREAAQNVADESGIPVTLSRFVRAETIEVIQPRKSGREV